MNKSVAVVAAVLAAVVLGGCGGTPVASTSAADPAATSAPSAEDAGEDTAATDEPTEESTPEDSAASDAPVAFGQTFKYEDGLQLTVTSPKKYKPSEYAAGADGKGTAVKFQVTLKNTGSKPYDPTLFSATVSSGDAESEQIYDSEKGIEGSPSTKVRPGKTVKFDIAYMVLKPADITMDVSPGFDYNDATFTNNP